METLISRLIDRPLRPMFPKDYNYPTQVIITVYSADDVNPPDVLALTAASAALTVSNIPFDGPLAGVRVVRVEGNLICNPSYEEIENSDLNFIIAGSADAILMVEGGADIVPEEEYRSLLLVHEKIREYQGQINGKTIPGTEHPINYFSIIDPATFSKARNMADGTFDIDTNKWIKKPEPGTFEPEKYVADFQKRVSEIDVVKGELVRDMIDYEELSQLTSADIENLSGLISKKLAEIKDSINTLIDIGDKTYADRKDAFDKDMSPDEIRKFGVKNRLPKNVIYKMLEKYHYLKFFKKLNEIMEDGKITPDELKSLSKIKEAKGRSIAFTFGRFNPPTIGHEKLINKVAQQRTDDYRIYLSKSEDTSKNPLNARVKLATMKQMFPRHARNIMLNPSNMILDIATELYNRGYSNVTFVAGSDRVREFDTILKKI